MGPSSFLEPEGVLMAIIGGAVIVVFGLGLMIIARGRSRKMPGATPKQPAPPSGARPPVRAGPGAAELIVTGSGRVVTLDRLPVTIGRASDNTLVLEHSTVSAHHARLYADKQLGLCIEDLGSLNGLRLNQLWTRKNVLRLDATLLVGEAALEFRAARASS